MEVHSAHQTVLADQINALKHSAEHRPVAPVFQDPIREFHLASQIEGTVRNWLTLPIKERERLVNEQFNFYPRQDGEQESDFETRRLERWRGLCVIIQEESRAAKDNQSLEAAKIAFKKLFPDHNWAVKPKV